MSEVKDLLLVWKERILKESKRGDKAEAIRRADVTQPTYDSGFRKAKLADLTDKEVEVIEAHINVLDERKAKLKSKIEQHATI